MLRNLIASLFLLAPFAAQAVEVETTTLDRDVVAWYASNDTLPVVHIVLSFEGAGYASDPQDTLGLAQLTATMLLEGAGKYDALAFQEALEENAISIDTTVSADRLLVHIHTLKEHAPLAGKLVTLALTKPRLDGADIARIKAAQQSDLYRASESAEYRAARMFAQKAFANHPYANPKLGDAEGIARVSESDVRQFIDTYLTSGNLTVSAAGDVDDALLDDMLSPLIRALPNNETGVVGVANSSVQAQGTFIDDGMNVPQSTVLFAAPGIRRSDPEFYAAYLLMEVVGGGGNLTSRLNQELRQKDGLVYSVSAGLDEYRGAVLLNGALSTRNIKRDEAIERVKETLRDLYMKGVTTQECSDIKTFVKGNFPLQMDNTRSIASMLLTMQIFDLGEDYIAKRNDYFDAVSCSDMNRAAKTLLDPSRLLFISVGGKPEAEKTP
ncbi:MAG: insulinase family protein [Alphaproteobacteria bacterium]|nr:insulinase family protein [Alphaproteobacteria bacterium]